MEPVDLGDNQPKRGWKAMGIGGKIGTVIIIAVFVFVFFVTLDANKYRATVRVIEGEGKVGINPTALALDFGDLSRGTAAVRKVTIDNRTSIPMFIMVAETGEISSLVELNKNFFRLPGNETAQIEFSLYMPASAEIGANYTGRVYLFKVPVFF